MRLVVVAAALAVAGCAIPLEKVKAKNDIDLCALYGDSRKGGISPETRAAAREEIIRRGLMNDSALAAADAGVVRLGGPLCMPFAAHGTPEAVNRTTTASTVRQQIVFRRSIYSARAVYVYVENGQITAVQD